MNHIPEKSGRAGLGAKLALGFAAVAILISGLLTLFLYMDVSKLLRSDIEQRLQDTASIAALQLSGDIHSTLKDHASENTQTYRKIQGTLQRIRARGTDIRNVYTVHADKKGRIVYMVDAGGKGRDAARPGDVYEDASPFLKEKFSSLTGPMVEKEYYTDSAGTWLKGYAPFFDSTGKMAGVLAMDIAADNIMARQDQFLQTALAVLGLCVVLAGIIGLLLGRRMAAPIEELTLAARAIANGDLSHRAVATARDETGELARAFNAMTDRLSRTTDRLSVEMHDRKAAQHARDLSEENYRGLYDNASVGLYKTRFEDGKVIACNNRFAKMLGYESGDTVPDILLGPDRYVDPQKRDELNNLLKEKGLVDNFEALFNRSDKSTFWIRFSSRLSDDGQFIEGMAVDFTTEKTAMDQIKSAEKKFRSIFENAQEGLFQCTPKGKFVSANPALSRILGYESSQDLLSSVEAAGRELFANQKDFKTFTRALESEGRITGFETRFYKKDRSTGWGSLSATIVYGPDGQQELVEGSLEDIAQRKQAEAMRQEKNEAEAANREKSRFLAALSHEMRTPMTAIIGMTELLDETGLSEQQSQYVNLLKSGNERLLSLISDIMDISRIETGSLELETIPFNLLEIVEKSCETMAVRAHEKNLELACSISPKTPVHLLGDPYRLRQVLNNLVENAIKFTEQGEVVVTVRGPVPGSYARDQVKIEFCVTDTGIGISEDKLPTVFDHFSRTNSTSQHYGGTGVGLSISRRLVELMKGEFTVTSEVDSGSTFCFTVMCGVREKSAKIFAAPSPLKGLSVIIADNDAQNRSDLREMLNVWGARVTEAKDGLAAIDLLKDTWMQTEHSDDLILVDQDLPGMDGIETAGHIKMEHLCRACVLMLKPSHTRDDRARARKAGVCYFVKKPIESTRLLDVLLRATREGEGDDAGAGALPSLDILLVEDSETNRFVIRAYLKNTPWRVDMAENGLKALEKFKTRKYDLVLMDIQMPVMDGHTAMIKIREWEKENNSSRVPIIATTIFANADDEKRCKEAGADAYLSKPVKKNTLLAAILSQIIGGKKSFKPEPDLSEDIFFPQGDEPILAWVDPELAEAASHYLQALPDTIEEIMEAARSKDFKIVADFGRKIMDKSKSFGLEEIQKLGAILLDTANNNDDSAILDCIEKLTKYLDRVQIV